MRGHIWMTLLLVVEAQQLPPFRYHSWLYATPWRPLLPAPTPGAQHLSLGYTGPQTFPGAAGRAQPAARRPVVLGLVRPVRHQFMLPFRPSPFAGYSNEQGQEQQLEQQQEQEEEPQQEPLFHAPGYRQVTAHSKPIEEYPAEALPAPSDAEQHYLYMSAGNLYQLVRS